MFGEKIAVAIEGLEWYSGEEESGSCSGRQVGSTNPNPNHNPDADLSPNPERAVNDIESMEMLSEPGAWCGRQGSDIRLACRECDLSINP